MLTFEEAKRIALDHIGPDSGLIESAVLERPYGWYFEAQSKEYLRTSEFRDLLVGSGGFLVERDTGRIVQFGSAFSRDHWLAAYERGFKYEAYDLTIKSVSDMETALRLISLLRMVYVEPELEHGRVWRIPKAFTLPQLRKRLASLPTTFSNQKFWAVTDVFLRIDAARCCAYSLSEHRRDDGTAE